MRAHGQLQPPETIKVVQAHRQNTRLIFVICVDWTNNSRKSIANTNAIRPTKYEYALPTITDSVFSNPI